MIPAIDLLPPCLWSESEVSEWSEWVKVRIFLSSNWLKLCTPTSHYKLLFLYLWIFLKQICCGFTECRLARVVPTCPAAKPKRGSDLPRLLWEWKWKWKWSEVKVKWVKVRIFYLQFHWNFKHLKFKIDKFSQFLSFLILLKNCGKKSDSSLKIGKKFTKDFRVKKFF